MTQPSRSEEAGALLVRRSTFSRTLFEAIGAIMLEHGSRVNPVTPMAKQPPRSQRDDGAVASSADGERASLHRDRVIETAIAILDAEGPQALTFRRLAAELDAGVATLYWHVENKEALLQLALDRVLGEIRSSFPADPERPWEE